MFFHISIALNPRYCHFNDLPRHKSTQEPLEMRHFHYMPVSVHKSKPIILNKKQKKGEKTAKCISIGGCSDRIAVGIRKSALSLFIPPMLKLGRVPVKRSTRIHPFTNRPLHFIPRSLTPPPPFFSHHRRGRYKIYSGMYFPMP